MSSNPITNKILSDLKDLDVIDQEEKIRELSNHLKLEQDQHHFVHRLLEKERRKFEAAEKLLEVYRSVCLTEGKCIHHESCCITDGEKEYEEAIRKG